MKSAGKTLFGRKPAFCLAPSWFPPLHHLNSLGRSASDCRMRPRKADRVAELGAVPITELFGVWSVT